MNAHQTHMRLALLLPATSLLLLAGLRADPYFVVPPDTPDHEPGDFLSWETAATNIQDAVTAAGTSGATVWVKPGHYVLSAQIVIGNLKLRSWPDGLTNRDTTIVDGNYPNTTNRCFYLNNAAALVEGFTITNGYYINTSTGERIQGGGVTFSRPQQLSGLRNCLIADNTANDVDGVYSTITTAGAILENCTIVNNTGGTTGGLCQYINNSSRTYLTNSIVYGNTGTYNIRNRSGAIYSDHVLTENTIGVTFVGDGNITDRAPVFVDATAGNYRLRSGSPGVDAGVWLDWMVDALDLGGKRRIDGISGIVDIGAYEFQSAGTVIMIK